MKHCYTEKNFRPDSLRLIAIAEQIMTDYAAQGYDLSLRQLYYQFVARNHIPNSEKSYKNLGSLISDARLAGLLDWEIIKDRGREMVEHSHWTSPSGILETAARQFRLNLWEDQPNHVLVMVEKQALEGVLLPVCRSLDVPFMANKGYSSSTALYELGRLLNDRLHQNKEVYVLYLGDHDPSGIDMTRDVDERLELFADGWIETQRLALNMDQVEEYGPPENPAKTTDSRYTAYIERFGESSWELDALEPSVLAGLVRERIEALRDDDLWNAATVRQNAMKADLKRMADDYRYDP